MIEEIPNQLRNAAILQIVAGLLNLCFTSWMVMFGFGLVCGVVTLGVGTICGLVGLALIPLGLLEVAVGAMTLANPRQFGQICRTVAYLETGSILLGSLTSAAFGGVILSMTSSEDVQHFLRVG